VGNEVEKAREVDGFTWKGSCGRYGGFLQDCDGSVCRLVASTRCQLSLWLYRCVLWVDRTEGAWLTLGAGME
jgi:hypothetical protein